MTGIPFAMFDIMPINLKAYAEVGGISLESFNHTPLGMTPSLPADDARGHAPFSAEVFA